MAISSAEEFLAVLHKSELLNNEQFAEAQDATLLTSKASELADMLIRQGTITPWQAEQLLAGRSALFLGNYALMELLGRGGMGSVFLAKHRTMKRRVALKVVSKKVGKDPASLERFLAEARSIAALDHPNIVRAYDVGKESDRFYIVMEYVEGQDLEAIVKEQGLFDYEAVAYCIRQAAEGLAHAHSRNMIHCDIKPSNLLLSDQGTIKILDMGMARLVGDEEDSAEQADQKVLGTVDYMAPEQAMEGPDFDHRADIYSLGCTLYFLLTGQPPFNEGTLTQRIVKHQTSEPPDILQSHPDAPRELVEICKKMMAKDPSDRYQSTEQIAGLLNDWEKSRVGDKGAAVEGAEQTQQSPQEPTDKAPSGQLASSLAMEELPSSDKVAAGPALNEKETSQSWNEEQQTVLLVAAAVVFAIVILSVALIAMVVRPEQDDVAGSLIAAHTTQVDDSPKTTVKKDRQDSSSAEPGTSAADPKQTEPRVSEPVEPVQPSSPPDAKTSQDAKSADKTQPVDKAKPQPDKDKTKRDGKAADRKSSVPDGKPTEETDPDEAEKPPARPEDPFADFPTMVDLPKGDIPNRDSNENPPTPFRLAKIYPKPDSVLKLGLVGGDAALAGKDRFVLSPLQDADSNASAWLIRMDKGRQSDDVALIRSQQDELVFEWLEDDVMDMARNLKNCALDITIDGKTRTLVLQRPRPLGALTPSLENNGTSTTVLTSNCLPDVNSLRLEVTALKCGETGEKSQDDLPVVIRARQHKDIQLNVKEVEELFVRVSYVISGGETQAKLECFCKHSRTPRAVRLDDSEWKKLQSQGIKLEKTIPKLVAELARQKRPTQSSALKQKRLEAMQKRFDEIVALFKFRKAVLTNGSFDFREYIEDDGRQIDLSNSDVADDRREKDR